MSPTCSFSQLLPRAGGGALGGAEPRAEGGAVGQPALLGGANSQVGATANDKDDDDAAEADDFGVLRRGSRGEGVKLMQAALGVTADGVFGPGTERVLKEWQAKNGLTADGIAGPKTLEKLLD